MRSGQPTKAASRELKVGVADRWAATFRHLLFKSWTSAVSGPLYQHTHAAEGDGSWLGAAACAFGGTVMRSIGYRQASVSEMMRPGPGQQVGQLISKLLLLTITTASGYGTQEVSTTECARRVGKTEGGAVHQRGRPCSLPC